MTSDQSSGRAADQPAAEQETGAPARTTQQQAGDKPAEQPAGKPADKPDEKPARKAPARKADPKAEKGKKSDKGEKAKAAAKAVPALVRTRVAQAIWILCVLAAAFLALGALVIALDFNQQNAAVEFVLNGADAVDLGVFTRDEGIKQFTGENAETKNALVNYGVGALFWIVAGRIADRFIRP